MQMANDMDNTGDIMNELVENPDKMGNLLNLINEQPRLAMQRMATWGSPSNKSRGVLEEK